MGQILSRLSIRDQRGSLGPPCNLGPPGRDSDLEVFSHHTTDGSCVLSMLTLSKVTSCWQILGRSAECSRVEGTGSLPNSNGSKPRNKWRSFHQMKSEVVFGGWGHNEFLGTELGNWLRGDGCGWILWFLGTVDRSSVCFCLKGVECFGIYTDHMYIQHIYTYIYSNNEARPLYSICIIYLYNASLREIIEHLSSVCHIYKYSILKPFLYLI